MSSFGYHGYGQQSSYWWDASPDRCQGTTQAGNQCPYGVASNRYKYCNIHGAPSTAMNRWDASSDRCQAVTAAGHQCPYGVADGRYKYCNVHGEPRQPRPQCHTRPRFEDDDDSPSRNAPSWRRIW